MSWAPIHHIGADDLPTCAVEEVRLNWTRAAGLVTCHDCSAVIRHGASPGAAETAAARLLRDRRAEWRSGKEARARRAAWEFPHGTDLAAMVGVAHERRERPDLEVRILKACGGAIVVEVLGGVRSLPEALLYVERRGCYAVVRERSRGGRRLLGLRAHPAR